MKKLQVFVSSTFTDLAAERQAAVQAILKAGHIPAGMELFASSDESQMETIRRWIDQSDVYMLILGGRYGSVDNNTSLSYTELEYDYALAQGIPAFAVVISENGIDAKVKQFGRGMIETEHGQELKLFRTKVLGKTSLFFDDTKDIKLAVHETLNDFAARKEFVGWVPGNEVTDSKSLLEEVADLSKRNSALVDKVAQLEKKLQAIRFSDKGGWTDDDFATIVKLLKKATISTDLFDSKRQDVPLLNLLLSFRDRIVTGIDNSLDMSTLDQLLFFNVLPKIEIHGLAVSEKVVGVRYRRKSLTPKGHAFFAYTDRTFTLKSTSSVMPKPDKPDEETTRTKPTTKKASPKKSKEK